MLGAFNNFKPDINAAQCHVNLALLALPPHFRLDERKRSSQKAIDAPTFPKNRLGKAAIRNQALCLALA